MNKIDIHGCLIAYVCDQDKCDICHGGDNHCKHTTDIDHALNFKKVDDGKYIENEEKEVENLAKFYKVVVGFDKKLGDAISSFISMYPEYTDELYDAIYRVLLYLETSIWCGK